MAPTVPSTTMGEFVMVPVPEEIEKEIKDYLAHNVGRRVFMIDKNDAIVGYYREAPGESRQLLRAVADATVEMAELTLDTTCRLLDISPREMMGLVYEINFHVSQRRGPAAALYAKPGAGEPPSGVEPWAHRIWVMDPEVAQQIIAA